MTPDLVPAFIAESARQPVRSNMEARPVGAPDTRLDLLYEVSRKASNASKASTAIPEIVTTTRQALNAAASSLLLIDEDGQHLLFEFADGASGGTLQQMRLDIKSGIAGWVARHGVPLIVNDVASDPRFFGDVDKTTGFVTRAVMCSPLVARGRVIGVIEVLNKLDGSDFDDRDLQTLTAVAATAAIAIENSRLHQSAIAGYKGTISALAAVIDAKDPCTRGHSQRVLEYALMAGEALGLPQDEIEILEYAAILHDIGKIGIADSILTKPGKLTEEEARVFREHPVIGANIIADIPFLSRARRLVLHHHERYDGMGYPDGLAGEDIPLAARLLAVADTFDSITTDRPYRAAPGKQHAIDELRRCSGTQFCPIAVDSFIAAWSTQR
jgi:HD-GYP domain-containing protein (c-di-GMP phosphodiesterase class II)